MTEAVKVVELYGEKYIKLLDAFEYLESREVIYELKNIYFKYSGFGLEYELDFNSYSGKDLQKRYVRGISQVSNRNATSLDLDFFWVCYEKHDYFRIDRLYLIAGFIDGVEHNKDSISEYLNCDSMCDYMNDLEKLFDISFENCFIKKSELDELAKKYGIPHKDAVSLVSPVKVPNKLNPKAETTYLHLIGVLLDYIKGEVPSVDPHPSFTTEAAMIALIDEKYNGYSGLKKRNLEDKFAQAKKKMKEL